MNLQAQNFLSLLRSFLRGGPAQLTAPDWDEIYLLAKKNNLAPAICDAARTLPEFSAAPQHIRRKFTDTLIAQSGAQLMRTESFFEVYKQFLAGYSPGAGGGYGCFGSIDFDRRTEMRETEDLFEALASGTACDYISDLRLPLNREHVRAFLMGWTPARDYGVRQWEDLAEYLLGEVLTFSSQEEAQKILADRLAI